MEITFDGLKMRNVSVETPIFNPRVTAVTLLNGDTHVQTEGGKFGVGLSFTGVADNWNEIVTIGGKLGVKGALITSEYTLNGCAIISFRSNKIKGTGSKYKYEISFVKEGGGI